MMDKHHYVRYVGFVGEAKDRGAKTLGFEPERLTIVGRHNSEIPTTDVDVSVLIKPGTSKADTLALLDKIRTAVEAYGHGEHNAQSENVFRITSEADPD